MGLKIERLNQSKGAKTSLSPLKFQSLILIFNAQSDTQSGLTEWRDCELRIRIQPIRTKRIKIKII